VTTTPDRIERAQNARDALELRLSGLNFEQIGLRMGFSRQRAHQLVTEELFRVNAERNAAAAQLRTIEAERLDRLQAAYWPSAVAGDFRSLDRVLRIMERRARLMGLDAQPDSLSRDEAFLLVRTLIEAVEAEVDPETARRVRTRVCRTLQVDSSETIDGVDESIEEGSEDRSCETGESPEGSSFDPPPESEGAPTPVWCDGLRNPPFMPPTGRKSPVADGESAAGSVFLPAAHHPPLGGVEDGGGGPEGARGDLAAAHQDQVGGDLQEGRGLVEVGEGGQLVGEQDAAAEAPVDVHLGHVDLGGTGVDLATLPTSSLSGR
jgi:hypothetical protein